MGEPEQRDARAQEIHGDDPRLRTLFGAAYPRVARYAELLADEGVKRGLIGPREVPRLWERHLVNSAAVAAFLPSAGTVVDVGSGAGLPGVVLAAIRPDLHVVLLEPMERRATWLREVVAALDLGEAEVVRGRAEELHGHLEADVVTARAVAPMDRLAAWSLPLLKVGGVLLAMKGSRAAEEVTTAAATIRVLGGGAAQVLEAATAPGLAGTTVVRVVREQVVSGRASAARRAKPPRSTTSAAPRRSATSTSGTRSSASAHSSAQTHGQPGRTKAAVPASTLAVGRADGDAAGQARVVRRRAARDRRRGESSAAGEGDEQGG